MGGEGEGIRKYKLPAKNSHRDVKYGRGNLVSNIVTIRFGVRWVVHVSG